MRFRKSSRTFTGHHGTGLKAIITRTLEATDDVGACAVAAGVSNAALISVCYTDTVQLHSSTS